MRRQCECLHLQLDSQGRCLFCGEVDGKDGEISRRWEVAKPKQLAELRVKVLPTKCPLCGEVAFFEGSCLNMRCKLYRSPIRGGL